MPLDPGRTVSELRELQSLTGDENGAQRVAWTETWEQAREWLRGKVRGTGAEEEIDPAGNQWFTLRGASERALLIGGHIDSVPNGGWLDGSLNVVAGVEVLRRLAEEGQPAVTVRLLNWADEEGARFGRSLFGSSAAAGTMADQDESHSHRRRAVLGNPAQDFDSREDVERAVEPAPVGYGVDVPTDQNRAVRVAAEREPLVTGSVDRLLRPGLAHLATQPLSRTLPRVCPCNALSAVLVPGQLLELAQLRDRSARLERHPCEPNAWASGVVSMA